MYQLPTDFTGEKYITAALPPHADSLNFTVPTIWRNQTKTRDLVRVIANSTVAILLLIFLLPLLLVIALLIKLDSPGSILFKQERRGKHGKSFHIYKFRTMHCMERGLDAVQCKKNDMRITRLGAFLRRSSLDELPQLINIARGEMAIVGPRPHPLRLDAQFGRIVPFYYQRYMVVPGLTGLAQVRGFRGPTDTPDAMAKRIECDLEYVNHQSHKLDLWIIAKTIPAVIGGRNAF